MDMLLVSEQERQCPEAVSRSESAMFPLDGPGSDDVWSLVFFRLPATDSSSGLTGPLMGLEEGLEDSFVIVAWELDLDSGVKFSVWQSPCVELCSLPTSTSWEVMGVPLL